MSHRILCLSLACVLDLVAAPAHAAVVCAHGVGLAIPQDGEGLYVNFMTGASGRAEAAVPGFDLDVYASSNAEPPNQLKFYWGSISTGGAGVVTAGDHYAVLGTAAVVDGAAAYSRAGFAGDTSDWQAGTAGYLGVRFRNETSGVTNYGWVLLTTSAPLGFPATIHDWCYEDSGVGIATPTVPAERIFVDGFETPGGG